MADEDNLAGDWLEQIAQAEKDRHTWEERCDKIIRAYRDQRLTTDAVPDTNKKLNLFWSNIETLKPAVYSKAPQAIVERRFMDKDPAGRVASVILERCLRYEVQMSGFHHSLKLCRDDYLLVGRGIPWVRYNPEFGPSVSPVPSATIELDPEEAETEAKDEKIEDYGVVTRECLYVDYVYWKDFYTLGRPRVWCELQAACRRVYMTRSDMKDFGFDDWKQIPLTHPPGEKDSGTETSRTTAERFGDQATVYEIWDKQSKKVIYVAKSWDKICKEADALNLEDFWPFPRPAMTNTTNGTLEPVPDYLLAQDQYVQINDLTRRIDMLSDACRVAGVYDASIKEISRLFTDGKETNLIPVENYALFGDKGGLDRSINFVPLDLISKTLNELIGVRKQIIEDLDRLTGVWDIMRGESDPHETKGAQQLKQQNGMGRIGERQDDFARMCRDTIAIMGEIIAEHYDPKTILQISSALQDEGLVPSQPPRPNPQGMGAQPQPSPGPQAALPPQGMNGGQPGLPAPVGASNGQQMPMGMASPPMQPMLPPPDPMQQKMEVIATALQLLKDEKLRGFRIDIETDSTIQADVNQDKQAVAELLTGVTKFIETSAQIAQGVPAFAPLAGKMLQWAFRRYRVGRDLETAIEEFTEEAQQMAKAAAANPKPSPEEIKAHTEQQKSQAEIQRQTIENQGEQQNKQMQMMIDQFEAKVGMAMKQLDMQIEALKMHHAEREFERKGVEHQQKLELGAAQHSQRMEATRIKSQDVVRGR